MKKLDYPHVLNPFAWISWLALILLAILSTSVDLFAEIWNRTAGRKERFSVDWLISKINAKRVLSVLLSILINTVWMNRRRTAAYVRYLDARWFPLFYSRSDWRTEKNVRELYERYERSK